MELLTIVLLLVIGAALFFWNRLSSRSIKGRLPPGPQGLPLLGSMLSIDKNNPFLTFKEWQKTYGEIITFRNGAQRFVLLNSHRALKAAFLGQASVFSGRPQPEYRVRITRDSGIIAKDGEVWQEHRRFVMRVLRDFGFGKSISEDIVTSELEELKAVIDKQRATPSFYQHVFMSSICNVISRIALGERCGANNLEFKDVADHITFVTSGVNFFSLIPVLMPFVIRIPPLLAYIEKRTPYRSSMEICHDYIRKKIEEHVDALGSDVTNMDLSQASDVCEALLIEKAKQEKQHKDSHTYTEWQLIRNLLEFFIAGTETTSTTLNWAMFYMATNPDVQQRVHAEIDANIGHSRGPCMKDKPVMPYVNAVIDEVSRLASLVPTSVPHSTLEDTELLGCFIPKRTTVLGNLFAIHHSPEYWEKPEDFYPEHFLTDEGNYRPSEYLNAFSIGKRACAGETLARMELFLFFTGLMQSFAVQLGDPNVDVKAIAAAKSGIIRAPLPHTLIWTRRETA